MEFHSLACDMGDASRRLGAFYQRRRRRRHKIEQSPARPGDDRDKKKALARMVAAEPEVTKDDNMVGDGDCGYDLKRGVYAVLKMLDSGSFTKDAVQLVAKVARIVESSMGGTSGAIYAIFLNALSHILIDQDTSSPALVTPRIWAKALSGAFDSLRTYTPAQPGDRTLVDALVPFVMTLVETQDIKKAATAAQQGSERTKGM